MAIYYFSFKFIYYLLLNFQNIYILSYEYKSIAIVTAGQHTVEIVITYIYKFFLQLQIKREKYIS